MLLFVDMETSLRPAGAGIRWFDRLLRAATWLLALLTVVLVPLLALTLTERGDIRLPVELEPPYRIEFGSGEAIDIHGAGIGMYQDFPSGQERANLRSEPHVVTEIRLSRTDRDTRAVLAGTVVTMLALVWVGLVNLRRMVATARAGEPFHSANVRRLQRLGAALLAWPVVARVATWITSATLDMVPDASPVTPGPAWWVLVLLGVGMFALAEVLREGTALRELEQATV